MAAIPYSLVDNKLTSDPNDLRAQVRPVATIGIEELADRIVRPGSTVTKAEFLAMQEEFNAEALKAVLRGETVVTPLFIARATLTGVWTSDQDTFDPTRHHGQIRLSAGKRLRHAEAELEFKLERAQDQSAPLPERVEDFTSASINGTLTKGGVVRLTGSKLKYDPADPTQGVFLVKSTGAETRITNVKDNKPSAQLLLLPATLTAGTYRLEVRTKIKGSTQLKTATLGAPLTVA